MDQRSKFPPLDLKASLKIPILFAIAAAVITAPITVMMPNYYRSRTLILPVDSKTSGSGLGSLMAAATNFGLNLPGNDSADANFTDILGSRWVGEQLLKASYHYHVRSWRFGADQERQTTLYAYLGAKDMDQAMQKLSEMLATTRDLKSKVVTITCETKSPELSQQVAQQAEQLLEVFVGTKGRTRGGAKAAFATARLADSRAEMDQAEDNLRAFLDGNRNFMSSADPSIRLKGIRLETELKLRQQLVASIAMNREQALMEEKNDIPILNLLDPPNLPIHKSNPPRALITLLAGLLAGLGVWTWQNRSWVYAHIIDQGDNS